MCVCVMCGVVWCVCVMCGVVWCMCVCVCVCVCVNPDTSIYPELSLQQGLHCSN